MSNKEKQKKRRKVYQKAKNIKNNNLPKHIKRGITLTQKKANSLMKKVEGNLKRIKNKK